MIPTTNSFAALHSADCQDCAKMIIDMLIIIITLLNAKKQRIANVNNSINM